MGVGGWGGGGILVRLMLMTGFFFVLGYFGVVWINAWRFFLHEFCLAVYLFIREGLDNSDLKPTSKK